VLQLTRNYLNLHKMKNIFLIFLLVLPAVLFTINGGNQLLSKAEDLTEDEGDAEVEGEGDIEEVTTAEEEEEDTKVVSPDADTHLLFVKPLSTGASQFEIPAGVPVEFLVGFRNKGEQDFVVETLEASFRYPMDFTFYIQNFSAIAYNKKVPPKNEATFAYSFVPSETFAGRPFGLSINLAYRDASGNNFHDAIYNETVNIVELEEGLDGETFFLYIFLAAGVILLLVLGQQTLLTVGRKRTSRKTPVETGTSNPNNVEYEWLPQQTLASLNKERNKSPKSTKQSPRQRKTQRKAGSE